MDAMIKGLIEVLSLGNIAIVLGALLLGMIVGCIPGLTVTLGIILLLPLTYSFESGATAIIALLSVYVGGMYGGSISAILLNTPGTNAAIATCLDGHPLAKRGKAKKALDVSLYASVIGGLIAAFLLLFTSQPVAKFVSFFTSTEYFALAILGLSLIAGVSGNNMMKGIISGLLGILISQIGLDTVTGVSRFTFNTMILYAGLSIMPAMIAMIALIQIMEKSRDYVNSEGKLGDISKIDRDGITKGERIALLPAIWKSTWISSILGVMPGVGGGVSQFLCYNEVKRTSKKPQEFGKGCLEGIAAAESSNSAIVGTAMIPLLTLGIPGDGVTALLLGAFILHGIVPGPTMFIKQADTVYMIIFGLILANILLYLVGSIFTRSVAKIVQVKYSYLGPVILVFCYAGAFAANGSIYEIILLMAALVFTYLLVILDISTIPLMLGMILAPIIERNFVNSMTIYGNDILIFFKRPLSLAIIILTVILTSSFIHINKKIAKLEENETLGDNELQEDNELQPIA